MKMGLDDCDLITVMRSKKVEEVALDNLVLGLNRCFIFRTTLL